MANLSNAELWQKVREMRSEAAEKDKQNAALQAELDKLQVELDRVAAGAEALEYKIKGLEADLSKAITEKKLAVEKRMARARGYNEGLGKR